MNSDTRNTILAVVLSGLILLGWQFFYIAPQEKRRVEQNAQTQVVTPPAQNNANAPASGTGAPPAPGTAGAPAAPPVGGNAQAPATAPTQTRDAAVAAAPRVKIDT